MKTTKPLLGTERQLAEALNVDRSTIHAAIRQANITPAGHAGAHPLYPVRAVVDAIAPRTADGTPDLDRMSPNARDAYIRSERNLVKLKTECGQLIPVAEVERGHAEIFKTLALFLDTLPDVLERDCGLPAHALTRLEAAVDGARVELHKRLNAPDEAPAPEVTP
jgi:hypothetical protein